MSTAAAQSPAPDTATVAHEEARECAKLLHASSPTHAKDERFASAGRSGAKCAVVVAAHLANIVGAASLRCDAIEELVPPVEVKLHGRDRERWAQFTEDLAAIRAELARAEDVIRELRGAR